MQAVYTGDISITTTNATNSGGKKAPPDGSAAQSAPAPPPAKQSTVPPYSTDPAYAEIKTDAPYFSLINAVLTKGQDGGVNWDMASGTDAGGSGKSIYVALAMLKDAQSRFQQLATSDEPSSTLNAALNTAITVCTADNEKG